MSVYRQPTLAARYYPIGEEPTVPSVFPVYPGLRWFERETWDMFGIRFEGAPDHRRMFMYEEFVGHPLRKDYPKERRQPLIRRELGAQPSGERVRNEGSAGR